MPEHGNRLLTIKVWAKTEQRSSRNPVTVACLEMAIKALELAEKAEREGPQVTRRASSKGGFHQAR